MLLGALLGIADQFAIGGADNLRNTALVAALLLVGQGLRIWREGWEEQKQHDDEEDAMAAAEAAILEDAEGRPVTVRLAGPRQPRWYQGRTPASVSKPSSQEQTVAALLILLSISLGVMSLHADPNVAMSVLAPLSLVASFFIFAGAWRLLVDGENKKK
jgi:hypothetical protein